MMLLQIQQENYFLPTSKHPQAKVRRFLGICLYDWFIYRSNKCLETRTKQWIVIKNIPSHESQSKKRAKIAIHCVKKKKCVAFS